jgi:hypothetical protein
MNVDIKINEAAKTATITVPLANLRPSASGKTRLVATSEGNKETTTVVEGRKVIVGVNAYIKN